MNAYEKMVKAELIAWQQQMSQPPTFFNKLSKRIQVKINTWIPEKVHKAITTTIKQMVRMVLFGAQFTSGTRLMDVDLMHRERMVQDKIEAYKKTAAIEGGITGAGGLLMGMADFPILLGIKLKLLFEIAGLYGFDVEDY